MPTRTHDLHMKTFLDSSGKPAVAIGVPHACTLSNRNSAHAREISTGILAPQVSQLLLLVCAHMHISSLTPQLNQHLQQVCHPHAHCLFCHSSCTLEAAPTVTGVISSAANGAMRQYHVLTTCAATSIVLLGLSDLGAELTAVCC